MKKSGGQNGADNEEQIKTVYGIIDQPPAGVRLIVNDPASEWLRQGVVDSAAGEYTVDLYVKESTSPPDDLSQNYMLVDGEVITMRHTGKGYIRGRLCIGKDGRLCDAGDDRE